MQYKKVFDLHMLNTSSYSHYLGLIKYITKSSSFSSVYFAIVYSDAEICIIFDRSGVMRPKKLVGVICQKLFFIIACRCNVVLSIHCLCY